MRGALILALAAVVALEFVPAGNPRAGPVTIDKGSFKIYLRDRALGAEAFQLVTGHDSLVVSCQQFLNLAPEGEARDMLERTATLLVHKDDYSLRQYVSTRTLHGTTTQRELVVADTHYVAYRQVGVAGEGESRVLPPGRIYVMDAQIITLFDLVGRSLHGKTFDRRPINLLALGPRDTMLDARVIAHGSDTLRWGAKRVVARKLSVIADTQTTFTLWMSPQGQLLRLLEPVGGLRAEREPPDVKRAAKPPSPKPGG